MKFDCLCVAFSSKDSELIDFTSEITLVWVCVCVCEVFKVEVSYIVPLSHYRGYSQTLFKLKILVDLKVFPK